MGGINKLLLIVLCSFWLLACEESIDLVNDSHADTKNLQKTDKEDPYDNDEDSEEEVTLTPVTLIEENNFHALKAELTETKKLLIVEFHSEHCPYCRLLEEDFLKPMMRNETYREKVMIRKVDVGIGQTITDFDGREVPHRDFINRYRAGLTPTMVFLDKDGFQVAERMVGINTVDFFGAYLDVEIEKGLKKIRGENWKKEATENNKSDKNKFE